MSGIVNRLIKRNYVAVDVIKPFTAGVKQTIILKPVRVEGEKPKKSIWQRLAPAILTKTTVGYHGTSTTALAGQLQDGKFADHGKKVYFSSLEDAGHYALKKAELDKSEPIIIQIYSEQTPTMNELILEGHGASVGSGAFSYVLPAKGTVFIEEAFTPLVKE